MQDRAQAEVEDPSNVTGAAPGTITVAHEIRKLFLVSDNRSFNRLFDLVGRTALNRLLWDAGLASARLFHRLHDSMPSAPSDDAYVLSRPTLGLADTPARSPPSVPPLVARSSGILQGDSVAAQ